MFSSFRTNAGLDKDTSQFVFLVWFSGLTSVAWSAERDVTTVKSTTRPKAN